MKKKWVRRIVILAIIIAALCASTMTVAFNDYGFICENTGSRKGYREWFFGLETNKWYRESELEAFLRTEHPESLENRWTSYFGNGSSLIPLLKSYGHGRPGAILEVEEQVFNEFVRSLTSEHRLEFYRDLKSADQAVIEQWIGRVHDMITGR
jgi:hypothetical protein